MSATILERSNERGAYGMPAETMIVEHPEYGRLLLVEGYGGESQPMGGAYRWEHGVACRLRPGDTLESLHAGAWNEGTTLYQAVVAGYDDTRPVLDWTGHMVRKVADAACWMTSADFRALRESWGLSQQEMADELGVSQGAVSYMETGERPITARTLRALEMARQLREAEART